ncbi:MAG: DUF2892 domain-containing protein [Thioalkalispiraceae bacterium]|jgi:hypothetical protein
MDMQQNMGKLDVAIRYILGIVLLAIVVLAEGPWRWVGLIGIIPIATAVINWCPIYRLFGISTRERGHGPTSKTT